GEGVTNAYSRAGPQGTNAAPEAVLLPPRAWPAQARPARQVSSGADGANAGHVPLSPTRGLHQGTAQVPTVHSSVASRAKLARGSLHRPRARPHGGVEALRRSARDAGDGRPRSQPHERPPVPAAVHPHVDEQEVLWWGSWCCWC
ncbi:unnamed protein product, partial [Ectocarpus sp. 12 AP-2014]